MRRAGNLLDVPSTDSSGTQCPQIADKRGEAGGAILAWVAPLGS
jgi:hypothetical protein